MANTPITKARRPQLLSGTQWNLRRAPKNRENGSLIFCTKKTTIPFLFQSSCALFVWFQALVFFYLSWRYMGLFRPGSGNREYQLPHLAETGPKRWRSWWMMMKHCYTMRDDGWLEEMWRWDDDWGSNVAVVHCHGGCLGWGRGCSWRVCLGSMQRVEMN